MARRALLFATAAAVAGLTGAASACPAPQYKVIAPDVLPPSPTVFVISYRRFFADGEAIEWTTKPETSWFRTLGEHHGMEGVEGSVYHGGDRVPTRFVVETIGEDVIGRLQIALSEGDVVMGDDDVFDGDRYDGDRNLKHRQIVPRALAPWVRVSILPSDDDPFYSNGLLVGRDGPEVNLELEGWGIGLWSVETLRCHERLVAAGVVSVPTRCVGTAGRIVVVSRAFDGSVIRTPVDVGRVSTSATRHAAGRGADVAGALVLVVLALTARRRKRTTAVLP